MKPTLDTFTRAYIQTALATSTEYKHGTCPCCEREALLSHFPEPEYTREAMCSECGVTEIANPDPIDRNYSMDDLSPETLARMVADCERFQWEAVIAPHFDEAGADFWLTRNRHGAGFWDGDWPDSGEELTRIAHSFGECSLYAGDDGQLYLA